MKVELFIPCFIDQIHPETAFNTIKVLEKLGCKVSYNDNQTCCGQPAFNSGFWDEAKEVGSKFLDDFTAQNYIVGPSGSCVGMVKNYYNDLFTNALSHNKCRAVQNSIYELSDFIVNVLKKEEVGAKLPGKAVYHDSCGALRECKIKNEPRKLLKNVEGLELVEMNDVEVCCGFGGTFSVKFEAISSAMAEQKINNALATGANYIISTDTSCLMHLQGYIEKNDLPIRTMHIADVLASGW
ncbi:(Fe-S)-binding protein [Solitalea lacus]|uniref:(Fe-S)-binding protein n=1 Tax=Solitalea lacus TaxID=2911172 RepID=UPI001ED9CCCF|nr:(Fe-S)-binding protein [Solitalea lacus]UKJ05839.1 (Fe-S)-binding protein [Solitalea lacus]